MPLVLCKYGWFGPASNHDSWPLMVALKVLAQYHAQKK